MILMNPSQKYLFPSYVSARATSCRGSNVSCGYKVSKGVYGYSAPPVNDLQ